VRCHASPPLLHAFVQAAREQGGQRGVVVMMAVAVVDRAVPAAADPRAALCLHRRACIALRAHRTAPHPTTPHPTTPHQPTPHHTTPHLTTQHNTSPHHTAPAYPAACSSACILARPHPPPHTLPAPVGALRPPMPREWGRSARVRARAERRAGARACMGGGWCCSLLAACAHVWCMHTCTHPALPLRAWGGGLGCG